MPTHSPRGHGYPLASYHPRAEARKTKFVLNTFTPVFDQESSAVVEMKGLANWGNHWSTRELQDHMLRDVKSSPCHILCLQEAEADPMECLERPPAKCGVERTVRTGNEGKFVGARGSEACFV